MSKEKEKEKINTPPPEAVDFSQDAGAGFEHVSSKDVSIPFMAILQDGSPEVKEREAKYIPGARPGLLMNTVTKAIFDVRKEAKETRPLVVVPCGFQKLYVEWKPRPAGGYVQAHPTEEILAQTKKNDKNKDVLPNGNIIETTAYHSVLVFPELVVLRDKNGVAIGVEGPAVGFAAVIAMASTQLKQSRKWVTLMSNFKVTLPNGSPGVAPMYSRYYGLSTVVEAKDGNSWYGWNVELVGMVKEVQTALEGRTLHKQVASGALALPAPTEQAEELPGNTDY